LAELDEIREKKMKELKERYSKKFRAPKFPIKLSEANFKSTVEENPVLVVDLWSEWCPPCKMIEPIIEELANDYAGRVVFGKLNTDESPAIAVKYNVAAIPTLLFFKNGKFVDRIIGAVPKEHIDWKLKKIIGEKET
jgi:thioredoxin 1